METLKELYDKYKSIILYLFFGGCTTVINIASYFVVCEILLINNFSSTVIAWFVSVLFAFFTNKKYVFESNCKDLKEKCKELFSFFACRFMTGILDVIIMVIAVDYMQWNNMLWKIISNIIVIIINYIASKYFIFVNR